MSEDKTCRLLQSSESDKKKRKKKKRKKGHVSGAPAENTEKAPAVSLPPETLPVPVLSPQSLGQHRGQLPKLRATSRSSSRRAKNHPKDSTCLLTATNKPSSGRSPARGYMTELGPPDRESLRWEGVLEDPQAEEKRLEVYRANRRQRYISHREAPVKETQHALRQGCP